ncbi:hypothetical protein F3Y22_tig00117056pilonHSYRG01141 [Hibiscus syriacus]|uniref:Uncharacterized protein n=1 Tax=Hibiscus syriacus TaxID=106335 RepID=A0A6A2X775_HIBSY|nr:hypothetical protein F3Y22_tig00117056pilonHSYRG01141 [Hibiscus syriacus]
MAATPLTNPYTPLLQKTHQSRAFLKPFAPTRCISKSGSYLSFLLLTIVFRLPLPTPMEAAELKGTPWVVCTAEGSTIRMMKTDSSLRGVRSEMQRDEDVLVTVVSKHWQVVGKMALFVSGPFALSEKRGQQALKATIYGHQKPVSLMSVAGYKPSLLVTMSKDSNVSSESLGYDYIINYSSFLLCGNYFHAWYSRGHEMRRSLALCCCRFVCGGG